jgi:hypothetical protein
MSELSVSPSVFVPHFCDYITVCAALQVIRNSCGSPQLVAYWLKHGALPMFVTLLEWQLPKPTKSDMDDAKPSMVKTEVASVSLPSSLSSPLSSPTAKPAPPAIVRVASISLDDDSDDADDADDKDSSKDAAALPAVQRLPPVALTILPLILECVLGTKLLPKRGETCIEAKYCDRPFVSHPNKIRVE